MTRSAAALALALLAAPIVSGCGDEKQTLAPTAEGSTLAPSGPRSANAKKFVVDSPSSHVGFIMEAPLEKIRGKVDDGTTGELYIDPHDLTQTSGSVVVDISKLELFQRVRDENGSEFSDEKKNATQNKHARQWLEIDDTSPPDIRQRFSRVEFAIRSIEEVSAKDVTQLAGDTRKVTAKAKGDFLLHGRMLPETIDLDITFRFDGDKPLDVVVRSAKPMPIDLAAFEVKPRTRFGVLAEKTLDVLSPKVAQAAPVQLEIHAVAEGAAAPPMPAAMPAAPPPAPEPVASPAPSASGAPATSAAPAGSAAPSAAPHASAAPSARPPVTEGPPKK